MSRTLAWVLVLSVALAATLASAETVHADSSTGLAGNNAQSRFQGLVALREQQVAVQKQSAVHFARDARQVVPRAFARPSVQQRALDTVKSADASAIERADGVAVRPAIRFRRVRRAARRVGRAVRRVGRAIRRVGRSIGRGLRRVAKKAKKIAKIIGPILKQIVINYALTAIPVAGQIYAAYQVFKTIDDPKAALIEIAKQYLPGVIPPEVTEWVTKAKELKQEFNTYKQILKDPKAALRQYGRELVDQVVSEFDMTEVENAVERYKEVEEQAKIYIAIAKDPKAAIKAHGQVVLREFLDEHAGEHIKKAQEVVQQFKDAKRQFKDMVASEKARAEEIMTGILAVLDDPKGLVNAVVEESLSPVLRAFDDWKDQTKKNLRTELEQKTSLAVMALATEHLADEVDKLEAEVGQNLHLLAQGLRNEVEAKWNNNGLVKLVVSGKNVLADAKALARCVEQKNDKCIGAHLLRMANQMGLPNAGTRR